MNKILSLNLNGIGNVGAFEENVSGVKHHVHSCCLFFFFKIRCVTAIKT